MLQQQSEFLQYCYERAARAKQAADDSAAADQRAHFLAMERNWLNLASSQQFAERIGRYLNHAGSLPNRERVVPILRAAVFEPHVVRALCTAFDSVCAKLGLQGNDPLFGVVGKAVIEQARTGIKDPARLERGVLLALGLNSFVTDGQPSPVPVPGAPAQNRFLDGLSLSRAPLRPVTFAPGHVLLDPGRPASQVYFPVDSVVSLEASLGGDEEIQIAMVGSAVAIGAAEALERRPPIHRAVVQVGGRGLTCDAAAFRAIALDDRALLERIIRNERTVLEQVQLLTLCNARHTIEQRLARWLLHACHVAGQSRVTVTQERLASLLGVRRTSITIIASRLRAAGMISYARGKLVVTDTAGLRGVGCECCRMLLDAKPT